jgi:serine/threonine-protein kinase
MDHSQLLATAHKLVSVQDVTQLPLDPMVETIILEKDGKEMVRVPAGEFEYGNMLKEKHLDEFWIDKTGVTNAEYARFVQATGHEPPPHWSGQTPPAEIADHPVIYVFWDDAAAYANWAGKRLPTQEEWEKAARGTDGQNYPWGDQKPDEELCNFNRNVGGTTPVGKYSPQGDSPYGCADMSGNVWEWTDSWAYEGKFRVLSGGSWSEDKTKQLRCTAQRWHFEYFETHHYGFRLVVSP